MFTLHLCMTFFYIDKLIPHALAYLMLRTRFEVAYQTQAIPKIPMRKCSFEAVTCQRWHK